jgi:adenylate cyclase
MTELRETRAWLERADSSTVPVQGSCSIGRATTNQLVLADEKVSRKHAVVHHQGENEYWLVDLGSSNGTYLNGRRVAQPMALSDGANIQIGNSVLRFRQPAGEESVRGDFPVTERTLVDIRSVPCWLLLADIEGSTELSRGMSADQLPIVTGRWFSHCKQAIEGNGGTINKYLGDGFFAYWPATEATLTPLVSALDELKKLQTLQEPRFRVVLHHGQVFMGGAPSMGEESLSGPEVNFVFRMEKLAGTLKQPRLMSEAAVGKLGANLPGQSIGDHPLSGFEGVFPFSTF